MTTTLGARYRAVRDALRAAGLVDAASDARLLVAAATGVAPQRIVLEEDRSLADGENAEIDRLLHERLQRRPVGRIVGEREFWGLDFALSADTLEPRADTETVVETALALIDAAGGRESPLRIADLGTGTGAILVALLSELPNAWGLGTDRAHGALVTARANARRNGVGDRAAFAGLSWTEGLAGEWDLIVSNPPYIRRAAIAGLAPEVRLHDPLAALDGGEDGLDAYREIIVAAPGFLRGDIGALVLEIGYDQGAAVTDLCRRAGYRSVMLHRDLNGCDRVVVARPR